jgi:hypothetical protein
VGPLGPTGLTGPIGPVGPQGPPGEVPTMIVSCVKQKKNILCTVKTSGVAKSRGKATVRLAGTRKRATARGRGRLRVRLATRKRVRRSARVVVRYTSRRVAGRAVVRLGRTAKVKATRR